MSEQDPEEKAKKFHVADIVNVATGLALNGRRVEQAYDVMARLVPGAEGTNAWSQLAPVLAGEIERQHPWVKKVRLPPLSEAKSADQARAMREVFVAELAEQHGEYHSLAPMKNPPEVKPAPPQKPRSSEPRPPEPGPGGGATGGAAPKPKTWIN